MAFTGQVKIITLQQGDDANTRFALTLHQNGEDRMALAAILLRYKNDGFSLVKTRDAFMVNGELQRDEGRLLPALGYRTKSAFLRA